MNIRDCKLVELKFVDDGIDGNLTIAESFNEIPFAIKRVYYINNLKNRKAIRGKHAHKKLEQVLFCINGSFELNLDDGAHQESMILARSNIGVYMAPGIWHEMRDFSHDCVILVLASDFFKESDYIRDHAKFLEFVKGKR